MGREEAAKRAVERALAAAPDDGGRHLADALTGRAGRDEQTVGALPRGVMAGVERVEAALKKG